MPVKPNSTDQRMGKKSAPLVKSTNAAMDEDKSAVSLGSGSGDGSGFEVSVEAESVEAIVVDTDVFVVCETGFTLVLTEMFAETVVAGLTVDMLELAKGVIDVESGPLDVGLTLTELASPSVKSKLCALAQLLVVTTTIASKVTFPVAVPGVQLNDIPDFLLADVCSRMELVGAPQSPLNVIPDGTVNDPMYLLLTSLA
jgi:hypothetical protein